MFHGAHYYRQHGYCLTTYYYHVYEYVLMGGPYKRFSAVIFLAYREITLSLILELICDMDLQKKLTIYEQIRCLDIPITL